MTAQPRDWNALAVSRTTEAQFAGQVVGLATFHGWRPYHTHDSRRSDAGWPDYVFGRPVPARYGGGARIVFLELKKMTGRVTPDQRAWLDLLDLAGFECGIARPDRLEDLAAVFAPGMHRLNYHHGWDR